MDSPSGSGGAVQVARSSRRAIVRVIAESGAATRADIVERTGLSRSTVAAAIAEMVSSGALVEGRHAKPGARGRTPTSLTVAAPRGLVCGIDIGHRHTGVVIARSDADPILQEWVDVNVDADPTSALAQVVEHVERMVAEVTDGGPLLAIAATVPQPVSPTGQSIVPTPFLTTWHDLDVVDRLHRSFRVPVQLENDANAGALAEVEHHPGSVVFVKVSTGLGMGVVLDGKLIRGSRGHAGEIGHVVISAGGQLCGCGNRGCLETLGSLSAVMRALEPLYGKLSPSDLAALLQNDDTASTRAMRDAGQAIGTALAPVLAALQVERVVIDGPRGIPVDAIAEGAHRQILNLVHPEITRNLTVGRSRDGYAGSLMGALRLAADTARRPG